MKNLISAEPDVREASDGPLEPDGRRTLLQGAALQTLAYADVFDYPLRLEEVQRYLIGVPASLEDVQTALDALVLSSASVIDGWYTLRDRGDLIDLRRHRSAAAARAWPHAFAYARWLADLPFVRADWRWTMCSATETTSTTWS
jgi:hypothetical protein